MTEDIGNVQFAPMTSDTVDTGFVKNVKESLQRIRHTNSRATKDAGVMKGNPSIMGEGLDTST